MNIQIFILFFIFFFHSLQAQDRWEAFSIENKEGNELIGYKNHQGEVMIEPQYMGFTTARYFDDIIGVTDTSYASYYLTKNGRTFGRDSFYLFDNAADCESEGYIRFQDKKSGLVGMLDRDGKASIPAEYSSLMRVTNNMAMALKNAQKKNLDEHNNSGCHHYVWEGGEPLLITADNRVLVKNFKNALDLDLYSLEINDQPTEIPYKQSYKGVDGRYYTFSDFKKEFKHWLLDSFMDTLTKEKLLQYTMDSIISQDHDWKAIQKSEYMATHYDKIKSILNLVLEEKTDYFVLIDGLNPFIYYYHELYSPYFDNCGQGLESKYPVLNLIINTEGVSQHHIDFLKTESGYRFINM